MSAISLDDVHAADTNYLVREAMTTGYQFFSLITPPAYVAFLIARRGRAAFSINRLLRATWVGGLSGMYNIVIVQTGFRHLPILRNMKAPWSLVVGRTSDMHIQDPSSPGPQELRLRTMCLSSSPLH